MTLKKIQLFGYMLCCAVFTIQPTAINLYQQLCPEILRPINIQEPSESDQILINACIALQQHGTQQSQIAADIWDAIKSVDMFTHILPQYSRTLTLSGYIALSRQVAQMTDNLEKLQAKTALTAYLTSKQNVQEKMSTLVAQAGNAESFFFNLFRTLTEEEQAELDKIHNQLYFHNLGLEKYNENRAALELGPRLNQLHTLAWATLPPLLSSAYHKMEQNYEQWKELEQKQFDLKYVQKNTGFFTGSPESERKHFQERLDKNPYDAYAESQVQYYTERIAALKKYKDLSSSQITEQLNEIQEQFKKIETANLSVRQLFDQQIEKVRVKHTNGEELSDSEKAILKIIDQGGLDFFIERGHSMLDSANFTNDHRSTSKFASEPGMMLLTSITSTGLKQTVSNIAVPYTKYSLKNGFVNFHNYAYDTITQTPINIGQGIYHHLTENPVYNSWKKGLCSADWDPKAYTTKVLATGLTATSYTFKLIAAATYPYILYSRYYATKNLMTLIHEKQQQLIIMGHWAKSMQLLHATIAHDQTLQRLMNEQYVALSALFNPESNATSNDLKLLINTLLSSSFQGNDSFMLSQQGKILATHHLLLRIKGELIPYFEVQGQIDALLSVAKLYQEYQNHPRVTFCLPSFVDSAMPTMEATEYWHPLISSNFVVPNSVTMGNNGIKNLMITGPNAGGKTTNLMSLIINIIFAQSLGIAPSKELIITPFAKIHSYLDITTNLQEGLSLFAAEVDRAKKLKVSITSCTPGQKTFTIIDEIFSGTNPQVASDVGYTFAAQLGEMAHSMTIITTHFPRLTDIEKEIGTFTNYKVADATIMSDGKIVYPFKLIPGVSNQNIAQHMLEQQGII